MTALIDLEPPTCTWCHGPIPARARRDSIYCSKAHRQAAWRFAHGVGVAAATSDAPLRLAYADPPYIGKSARYYSDHADFAGEVDHADLIRRLSSEFDGWALSLSASSLQEVLALCPPGVRVASWHRGERPTRSRTPLNGWEPVIFAGGRLDPDLISVDLGHPRRVDVLEHFSRPIRSMPGRVVGGKPAVFCRWIFDLLGALPQDEFTDVFPGSGGVSRAWGLYAGTGATS